MIDLDRTRMIMEAMNFRVSSIEKVMLTISKYELQEIGNIIFNPQFIEIHTVCAEYNICCETNILTIKWTYTEGEFDTCFLNYGHISKAKK